MWANIVIAIKKNDDNSPVSVIVEYSEKEDTIASDGECSSSHRMQ